MLGLYNKYIVFHGFYVLKNINNKIIISKIHELNIWMEQV